MQSDAGAARWVADLTDAELQGRGGPATFFRAKAYVEAGNVRDVSFGPEDGTVDALVAGSGRQIYRVAVDPGAHGWTSRCSCPVQYDCKHVIAALITLRTHLATLTVTTKAEWEQLLAPLATVPAPPAKSGRYRALALEFAIAGIDMVALRPLREGNRGWVRQDATWNDITSPWPSPGAEIDPDQRAALASLYRAGGQRSSYAPPAIINLADLGALVWPTLSHLQEAGIEFVAGEGLRSVAIGDGAATVALDLTATPDGGLTARAVANVAPDRGRSFLIGDPAHGLGHLDAGELTLWPVTSPVPEALRGLLNLQRTADIPPADVNRFLTLYYPALARRKVVTSSDGAIAEPDLSPPRLHLDVVHDEGHVTTARWGFRYPSLLPGGDAVVLPLAPAPDGPPRDLATETRLQRDIATFIGDNQYLTFDTSAGPGLYPAATLRGLEIEPFLALLTALKELGVVVEETGQPADYEEASEPPVITVASDETSDRDWFNLHVDVTVDGQTVPFDQLFHALAVGDDALLLDSGKWFSLDLPELHALRRLIEEARELTDSPADGPVRISAFQASLWEELVELGVVARQSARWRESLQGLILDGDRPAIPQPAGLHAALRPYQLAGFQWLAALWDARLGGILADDMGLGKTLQTLALLERARTAGELEGRPVLVVAPASVVGTWLDEAARFAPELNVVAITATGKKREIADLSAAVAGAHVVVTSYTLLRLEDAEYRALPWSGLVLDEAQFVKNHRSRTYQAARRLGAPFVLAITGTPLENSLMDLWSMLSLSAPGLFARPDHFIERYRKPIENERDTVALETLRRRIRPFVLRRTKREVVSELPEKIEQVQRVDLTPAHRKVYDKYLQRERQRVLGMLDDMDRNRVAIFRALTMLRQLSLDPVLVDGEAAGTSAKVEALVEHVTELASEGHRALVFSSFTGYLALVREAFDAAGISYVYLDGRTRDRPAKIAEFRQGDAPVFLISLKAGGFGLTLTEADYVFVLDPWWNPAAEAQAIDRTHRIGQTRSVNVYRMVSVDTIEEKVVALQERKRQLFTSVVDSGSFASGAITAADIRGLFED